MATTGDDNATPHAAALSYERVGSTNPDAETWEAPEGFRHYARTVEIGQGDEVWALATAEVMTWGVKQRSGFRVSPAGAASEGADYRIAVGWGPLSVIEPVRVVKVVSVDDRCGFAYGTLRGHPVAGEEAFVVHRSANGAVSLTLRSLTRPAPDGMRRAAFPLLLLAQLFFRRRYLRAFAPPPGCV